MAIFNQDGSKFEPLGSMRQWDIGSASNRLMDVYDKEMIRLGGSPIIYYPVFIGEDSIDQLYVESRGRFWSPIGTTLHAVYEPTPSQFQMGLFGADSPDMMVFYLNYQDVLSKLNSPPKIGSLLFTPHLRQYWEIRSHKTGGYQRWGVVRLELTTVLFQEDIVTSAGSVKRPQPDFDIFGNKITS